MNPVGSMRKRRLGAGLLETLLALLASAMLIGECHKGRILVVSPHPEVLAAAGPIPLLVSLPPGSKKGSVEVRIDGARFKDFTVSDRSLHGTLAGLSEGRHTLHIEVKARAGKKHKKIVSETWFEIADLERPSLCEVLNGADCALPFPSSHWQAPAATPTGVRIEIPGEALPIFKRLDGSEAVLDTSRLRENDGFSPTTQILMSFPGGLDLVQSDVSRLLPATRTFDPERSLEADHPTVLIDWDTGERIAHFLENDVRSQEPARTVTFLRPAKSLTPGHRYIVAVRNLRDASGKLLEAEPAFAALRDGRPTTIGGVEARRKSMNWTLTRLSQLGVRPRRELILAFDFVVQSDHSLTHEMIQMRDAAMEWIDARIDASEVTFTVDELEELEPGCGEGAAFWRRARGTFEVPLFLTDDPIADTAVIGTLRKPLSADGVYSAPYALAIPCDVLDAPDGFEPVPGIVLGHGLFGNGPDFVEDLTEISGFDDFDYAAAATDWSGLSENDLLFIIGIFGDFDKFGALPDRLRQGQLATLVLGRMLARGAFNLHPAFQSDEGEGAISTVQPPRYFGASLGGIMGLMFAALSPDVPFLAINVGAINFSLLLQRATPFLPFESFLTSVNPDPLAQALGIQVLHEVWVKGESAGYATHITSDPLPGTPAKQVFMSVGLHDQAVPNIGSQLAGATLGLPVLEGSVMTNLAYVEEASGPQPSGYVVYDTGAYDPFDPAYEPFLPPLANLQAPEGDCDPHGRMAFIPAHLDQLLLFLSEGTLENFCTDDGICNASEPYEIPNGNAQPCNPLD